jgi:hypothetical protein
MSLRSEFCAKDPALAIYLALGSGFWLGNRRFSLGAPVIVLLLA